MKLHGFEQIIFLEFVRAGLWEKEIRISQYREVDYNIIMRLAEEQLVVGLITAGLKHVIDTSVPKEIVLQFVGQCIVDWLAIGIQLPEKLYLKLFRHQNVRGC